MQHFSTPTCYFPSTLLFLDGSHDFLLNFVLHLDESVAYRSFDEPQKALDYIHDCRYELDHVNQNCLSEYTEAKNCPLINHTMSVELAAIHAEVYNPCRFSEISVVVIDCERSVTEGLEFCRRIENDTIKKILLIGTTDEKLALAALNEGLIHQYIKKSDVTAAAQVSQSIHDLQLSYFQDMSDVILRLLSVTPPRCLHDKNFAHFFRELREEKGIIEYYLVDNSGSFFMLDDDANVSFLIVKNAEDLRLHHEVALDNGVSEDLLNKIAVGETIPGFWSVDLTTSQERDWVNCLVPAHQFVSNETYYYAYLPENGFLDASRQKIFSYHRYLEDLDAEDLFLR